MIIYTTARDQLHHIAPLVSYLLWVVIDELRSRDQKFDWAHKRFFGGTRAWTVGQLILSKLPSNDFSDDVVLWVSAFVRVC